MPKESRNSLEEGHSAAKRAADHAGDDFKRQAFDAFINFPQLEFTTEDVRLAHPEIPDPPDPRAWGQIALQAKRNKIVQAIGIVHAREQHGDYKTLWRKIR